MEKPIIVYYVMDHQLILVYTTNMLLVHSNSIMCFLKPQWNGSRGRSFLSYCELRFNW